MKNAFEGYITGHCSTCPDWHRDFYKDGIGCGKAGPITECPYYIEAKKEKEKLNNNPLLSAIPEY